jgi:RNA polymerase sigma-70 factor (ECF subfamily)
MTDREIITLYKSGSQESAFNAIVDCYSERLYWHIRRFLCSHDDTHDVLQDVFIKIWKTLPTFRGDSQLFTWIYRIATNEALNHLRNQKKWGFIDTESNTDSLARLIDDDPHFNGNALQRELHKAIQRLPEKQRLVFCMRYFDEMKYEDISEITGTSVGALKANYHHAYNKVRFEIEQKML